MNIEDRERINILRERTRDFEIVIKSEFEVNPPPLVADLNQVRRDRMIMNDILNARRKELAELLVNQGK